MAQIYQAVDTAKLIQDFGIRNFVETGTGIADTVKSILSLGIADLNVYSIEVMPNLYEANVAALGPVPNLHLRLGYTHDVLPEILKELSGPTLFFHDAHFPGADFGFASYTDEKDPIKNIPLANELECVVNNRQVNEDIFVLDDLWVYEDNAVETGHWPLRSQIGTNGIDFVFDLFRDTHLIFKSYIKHGFIILFPKGNELTAQEYILGGKFELVSI